MSNWYRYGKWHAAGVASALCIASQFPALAAAPGAPAGAAVCVACHGAQGEGSAAVGAPRLAGQDARYLENALAMFKAGTRANPVMQPIAAGLDAAQMHALAGYFAGLRGVALAAAAPPSRDLVRAGEDSFDLRQVAPQGMLDHRVVAYISRDPYNRWSP